MTGDAIEFDARRVGAVVIAYLHGRFTAAAGLALREWLVGMPRTGRPAVLLDLGGLRAIDAGGAKALLDAHVNAVLRSGDLTFLAPNAHTREMMSAAGLAGVVETFASEELALASLDP